MKATVAVAALLISGLSPLTGTALAHDGTEAGAERLGSVRFATSCAPAVQPRFDRAVALLHSFHLDAAVGGFTEVAAADPACGMAHWGVAMAWLGNPLAAPPSARGLQEGGAAVARARAAGARTARENDYTGAIDIENEDPLRPGLAAAAWSADYLRRHSPPALPATR